MNAWIWAANLLGWPLLHLSISFLFLRLPVRLFAKDSWLTAAHGWERHGRLYRDGMAIRRWKALLPDGAPWLGGMKKKKFKAHDDQSLVTFLIETRRAEWAHWCMFLPLPLFYLWNPRWACGVMTVYALAANLPCILAQRYNRILLARVLQSRKRAPQCP